MITIPQLSPQLLADSFVSFASLLALAIFAGVLRRERPRATITRRFLWALQLGMAIMGLRLVHWFTGWEGAGRLTFLCASLVPLAVLLVVEALLRRHGPLALKLWVCLGAAALGLCAFLTPDTAQVQALLPLAAFQAVSLLAMLALLVGRDTSSLTSAENAMINRLAMALVLIVPLALSDFRTPYWNSPVRLSGLAILGVCWLSLSVKGGEQWRLGGAVLQLGGVILGAAILWFSIAQATELPARSLTQVMAMGMAAVLLGMVSAQARRSQRKERQTVLLDVLADPRITTHADLLAALQKRALTSEAVLLAGEQLGDFDAHFFAYLRSHPFHSIGALAALPSPELREQFSWFFAKFGASHMMVVGQHPLRLLVLRVPPLARSGQLDTELRIAQRMALLLEERRL